MRRKIDKLHKMAKDIVEKHQNNDSQKTPLPEKEQQTVETLLKNAKKYEDFLAENEPRVGTGKSTKEVKSNVTDNESAKMKTSKGTLQGFNAVTAADEKCQVIIGAQAFGQGPEQSTLTTIIDLSLIHI